MERVTPQYLIKKKGKGEKAVLLTAYDYITAKIEDEAGIDVILVGDSYGTTVLGYSSTLPVTMQDMLPVVGAVRRGAQRAMVIADMPYMSYQQSIEYAIRNAGRFMRLGVDGVKLEGGLAIKDTIKKLVDIGIPVMGHIGMTPQSYKKFGGYRVRGKKNTESLELLTDATALEDVGVFSIIVECVPEDVTRKITEKVKVPVYGIGAGRYCDGQILVVTDILGFLPGPMPRFVKEYAHLQNEIREAINRYIEEVKQGIYPDANHTYL
ncbi:MAG: 3-methyl-2-oxobutanoate hydroxymethyltransferase [candidate division WOR-3 bacterium]|nr:3-methyl-2-oxobutanoate hydroxymethyltransferase [candidate division WOR-3 bacterium]